MGEPLLAQEPSRVRLQRRRSIRVIRSQFRRECKFGMNFQLRRRVGWGKDVGGFVQEFEQRLLRWVGGFPALPELFHQVHGLVGSKWRAKVVAAVSSG